MPTAKQLARKFAAVPPVAPPSRRVIHGAPSIRRPADTVLESERELSLGFLAGVTVASGVSLVVSATALAAILLIAS